MRRLFAIVRATALEILSEPLSLLLLLAALALAVLAPAFHYHQFGEATRMARDAGLSALFTGGLVWTVFGTLRSFRREVESGTLAMALSHPVSRGGFFLAKTLGAAVSYALFALAVLGITLVMVWGAAWGGRLAEQSGDIARIAAPPLAAGVATMLVPLILGAFLNRFRHRRFVLTAVRTLFVLACAFGLVATTQMPRTAAALAGAAALLAFPALVLLAASAAFAVRFKLPPALASLGAVLLAMLPALGNYYLADVLARGGAIDGGYAAGAALAALPAIAFFLLLGVRFMKDREIA